MPTNTYKLPEQLTNHLGTFKTIQEALDALALAIPDIDKDELVTEITSQVQDYISNNFAEIVVNIDDDQLKTVIEKLISETGGLTTDENGQIVVDFSNCDTDFVKDILEELIEENGGLVINDSGKLEVDFSSIDPSIITDAMESVSNSLTSRLTDAENDIDSLQSSINTNATNISNLESTVNSLSSKYIAITGSRSQIAGYETSNTGSLSSDTLTISISSADTTYYTTRGSCTLKFSSGSSSYCATKVIGFSASASTTLTISGATWVSSQSAPSWGSSGDFLILVAEFIGGKVFLSTWHNSEDA